MKTQSTNQENKKDAFSLSGIEIRATVNESYSGILTAEALGFLARLARNFEHRRQELLEARKVRQQEIRHGKMPDFPKETAEIRASDWRVAPIPPDLQDRRVEITGPVDRKMIMNALNSGASAYMADFEDSNSPTWENNLAGQINLRDAVNGTISFEGPEGKQYAPAERTATLLVRPRGLHLPEKHLYVDGQPISGALFDFGLFLFHNTNRLVGNTAFTKTFLC